MKLGAEEDGTYNESNSEGRTLENGQMTDADLSKSYNEQSKQEHRTSQLVKDFYINTIMEIKEHNSPNKRKLRRICEQPHLNCFHTPPTTWSPFPYTQANYAQHTNNFFFPLTLDNISRINRRSNGINHNTFSGTTNCYASMFEQKRSRPTFDQDKVEKLEEAFCINKYIYGAERTKVANSIGLTEKQVKIWFQNRRSKAKKAR